MSGKLVIAVILALQVSVSLCDLPQPDQELVDKYNVLKESFYKRLAFYFAKAKENLEPLAEQIPHSAAAKEYIEDLQGKPHVEGAVKVVKGLAGEVAPMVDKARTATLGLYGEHVRPWAGPYLDQAITAIKGFLDNVMPVEEP